LKDKNIESAPDLMSVRDIMSLLGIGRTKAYSLTRSGDVQTIRIGRSVKIPKAAILAFLENCGYNSVQADGLRNTEGGDYESYR